MENKEDFLEKWKTEDGDELKKYRSKVFIEVIGDGESIKEFDIDLYFRMIEKMTTFADEKIIIKLLDGTEIECII